MTLPVTSLTLQGSSSAQGDEGEADLRAKEKIFQLDLQRRAIDLQRLKLQNERTIEQLNRSIIDYGFQLERYKIQVADYQYDQAIRSAKAAAAAAAAAAPRVGDGGGASQNFSGAAQFGRTGRLSVQQGYGIVDIRNRRGDADSVAADAIDVIRNRAAQGLQTFIGGDNTGDVNATNLTGTALSNAVYEGIRRHQTRYPGSSIRAIDLLGKEGSALGIGLRDVGFLGGGAGYAGNTSRGNVAMHLTPSSRSGGASSGSGGKPPGAIPIPVSVDPKIFEPPTPPTIPAPLATTSPIDVTAQNAAITSLGQDVAKGLREALKSQNDLTTIGTKGALQKIPTAVRGRQI